MVGNQVSPRTAGRAALACGTVAFSTVPQEFRMRADHDKHHASSVVSDQELSITRLLNAPRELVFKVWTDPRHVMQWWGPQGFHNTACELDLRPGGRFALQMAGPDGISYPCTGYYEEIVPPERLVFVGEADDGHPCGAGLPPRARVTVTLVDYHGKTELTLHTRFESVAMQQAAMAHGYREGWQGALQRLADELANA